MTKNHLNVGAWRLDKVLELEVPCTTEFLFPEWGHHPHLEPFALSIHTWVLRNGTHTILIDTAAGNGKHRPETAFLNQLQTSYLARLAGLGVSPEAVTHVLFTHIHVDHVGWNTRLHQGSWQPTFPNARHLCTLPELTYYADPTGMDPQNNNVLAYADSVQPIRAAGLMDTIEANGSEVLTGIRFLPAPGHSIDHAVIQLSDGPDTALFVGDLLHRPIQLVRPELSSRWCLHPIQAVQSRQRIFLLAADHNALVLPSHFAGSSAGHVCRNGSGFIWKPWQSPE